jgi:hypothetical protein
MAALRLSAHRGILVLIALACVVGTSDLVPATGRPADEATNGSPEVGEPYTGQHHDEHGGGWSRHPFRHFQLLVHDDLIVGNYTLVSTRRVSHTVYELTYRARLTNGAPRHGLTALDAMAQLARHSEGTDIVDGELTFGDVAAGTSAPSRDTFTIRHDYRHFFDVRLLRWTVSAQRDLAVPTSWVGAWHVTLTYRDPATGAVTAMEETDGVIRADEPVGFGFSGPLAGCGGRMTDGTLALTCALRALPTAPCRVKGTLELTITRVADALTGSGAWHATGHGCNPPLNAGQTVAVSGIRLGRDPGPAPAVASTLLRRFVSQPLFVLFATAASN